jgi:ATP-dependent Clp protease adaptor protein ClpS
MSTQKELEDDFFDVTERDLEDEKQEEQVKPPKRYHVFIMNDDYSRWDFVVDMLIKIFGQSEDQANRTTRVIHTKGKGLAGTYTRDIAETKADSLNQYAQANEFPLHAETEVAEE